MTTPSIIEECARAIAPALFGFEVGDDGFSQFILESRETVLAEVNAVIGTLRSHGFITTQGLEAIKGNNE